jgi:hypothetical protein
MDELRARVEALERRLTVMETANILFTGQITENTKITERVEALSKENNELLGGIKNALRIFTWLGEALKWGAPIAGSITAIWMAVRALGKP